MSFEAPTLGDQNANVLLMQQKLEELGFGTGGADGVFGPQTLVALHAYQQSRNLPISDALTPQTWTMMAGGPGGWGPGAGTDYRQVAREQFGAFAAYLDQPEVGPIILKAAQEGWTASKLQSAIMQTNWWKSTSSSQRTWDALKSTDPAEVTKQTSAMVASINQLLSKEGTSLPPDRVAALAEQILRNGVSQDQIPGMVLADTHLNPTSQGGLLGSRMTQVRQAARDYAVPISDAMAGDWAKQIASGTQTMEGLTEYLRGQAEAAYASDPHLARSLAAGYSIRQTLDPQIATAASLLGIDPDTIDLRDPKWSSIVQYAAPDGMRSRTVDETSYLIKSGDDYWHTSNGWNDAVESAQALARSFGKA